MKKELHFPPFLPRREFRAEEIKNICAIFAVKARISKLIFVIFEFFYEYQNLYS